MSLSKRSTQPQQKHRAQPTDSMSTHFLELSSTLANTTNMSRRSMACGKSLKKIPKVINSLEKNIQTLKKYCTEMARERPSKSGRNSSKQPNHNDSKNATLERSSGSIDIDWVRNAYATSFGHATNNLVELYEFYRNHLEKSAISNGTSFSQSNHSTSIVRLACTSSISGREESKSSQSRLTPSLVSKEDSQEAPAKTFRRVSERVPHSRPVLNEEREIAFNDSLLNENSRSINVHNNSVGHDSTLRTKTVSTNYYNCPSRKNEDMPLAKQQLSSSHDNPSAEVPKDNTRKKRDPGSMPLQQKILRIQTEADREIRPPSRHEVKKFQLNLAAELATTAKPDVSVPKASQASHLPPKPSHKVVILSQSDKPAPTNEKIAAIMSNTLVTKTQIHLQRGSLPNSGTGLNISTNCSAIPAKPMQSWSRPAAGTPHVASALYPPVAPKRFINDPPEKSPDNDHKNDFDSRMIYEKNMLINKRKQEINSKLRHKEKVTESESNANECAPLSLNEAILLDPISPVGVQASEVECPYEEAGLFDEALELKKEKLPLSKHDLSLWENMNLVQEMHHNGELSHLKNSKNCKENIIAPALELIKKKKSFKKSKFYVEDIPHPKKTTRQVQLIDIDGMSPETFKTKERPKKNKKSASKQDSLLGCDISIGEPRADPLLNEIESIEFDL